MSIICPNCSTELPDDAVFCDQCGSSLSAGGLGAAPSAPAGEIACPQCGAPAIPGEAFCDSCGAPLEEPEVAAALPTAEPVPATEPSGAPSHDLIHCPSCGADNLPGSTFCSNCGIAMEQAAEAEALPEPEVTEEAEPEPAEELEPEPAAAEEPPSPTGQRRFVIRDTGAEIILPAEEGEHIIGREDPVSNVFPAVDMNPHDGEALGVSRHHAQLTIEAGIVFIQDLDSTNFTFVNRKKLAPRTPTALSNGDEVRLGKLVMTFLE